MGSLSGSPVPGGHRDQSRLVNSYLKLKENRGGNSKKERMFVSKVFIHLSFLASGLSILEVKTRSAVKYLGDTFLLPDGCPVDDPLVQRFYQLCLETRGGDTLCSTDRIPNGRSLTIPAFSNVCSAICHDMPAQDMKICPFKGEVLGQSPFGSEDGNGLRNSRQQIRSGGFSFNRFVQK